MQKRQRFFLYFAKNLKCISRAYSTTWMEMEVLIMLIYNTFMEKRKITH